MNFTVRQEENYWAARAVDEFGEFNFSMADADKDRAIFKLGMLVGRCPEMFARPIGQFSLVDEKMNRLLINSIADGHLK